MPAYLLVLGKAADRDRMAAYSRALPPVYSKYRGRYLALGGAGRGIDWLAGPVRDRSLVLARFDAFDDVLAFWWSEEYRADRHSSIGCPRLEGRYLLRLRRTPEGLRICHESWSLAEGICTSCPTAPVCARR